MRSFFYSYEKFCTALCNDTLHQTLHGMHNIGIEIFRLRPNAKWKFVRTRIESFVGPRCDLVVSISCSESQTADRCVMRTCLKKKKSDELGMH